MKDITTIKIKKDTKLMIDNLKLCKGESYDDCLRRIIVLLPIPERTEPLQFETEPLQHFEIENETETSSEPQLITNCDEIPENERERIL
jgi:hypothetical protein